MNVENLNAMRGEANWSTLSQRVIVLFKWAIGLVILLVPFGFIGVMDYRNGHGPNVESTLQVHRARVLKSNAVNVEQLPSEGWQDVALPYRASGGGPNLRSVWYRLEVTSTRATQALWAVYIPAPNGNYAVSVNGSFVADTDPMEPPYSRHYLPVILKFSGALLHAGNNTVDVHIVHETWWPVLDKISVGPDSILGPVYESAHFWAVTIKEITIIGMLVMSLTMVVLYRLRRRDTAFGWYSLAILFWAIHIFVQLVPRAPFSLTQLWADIPWVALGSSVICGAFFVSRFVGETRPRLERGYLCWGVVGVVGLAFEAESFKSWVPWFYALVWAPPILCLGINGTWRLMMAARDKSHVEARWFAVAFWWTLVIGTVDCFVLLGVLKPRPLYLTYVAGPVLLVFGLVLLRRFVRAADVIERTRDELEVRVAEKAEALERNLVRLKNMEREHALSAERERIVRDMHDGVGGQLVQALSIAANDPELQPMEAPLRICLEGLAVIIDSMEPVNGDLASVLGMLRMRMSHRFDAAGIKVRWDIAEIPALSEFGPKRVLQVTQIVQEAIANALKHSGGKQITVRTRFGVRDSFGVDRATVTIEILDDGKGFVTSNRGGRGLNYMRRCALELEGNLAVDSCGDGATIRFEFPLHVVNIDQLATATCD